MQTKKNLRSTLNFRIATCGQQIKTHSISFIHIFFFFFTLLSSYIISIIIYMIYNRIRQYVLRQWNNNIQNN